MTKTLILIDRCWNYFSIKIMDKIYDTLSKNIVNMTHYELLTTIRILYPDHSTGSRQYVLALQKYLVGKHIFKGDLEYSVPLILKVIKWSWKHHIRPTELF